MALTVILKQASSYNMDSRSEGQENLNRSIGRLLGYQKRNGGGLEYGGVER